MFYFDRRKKKDEYDNLNLSYKDHKLFAKLAKSCKDADKKKRLKSKMKEITLGENNGSQ